NAQQVMVQLSGMGFVAVFAPIATAIILFVLRAVFGSLRVADEDEIQGLDLAEHSESAYGIVGGSVLDSGAHGAAYGESLLWQMPQLAVQIVPTTDAQLVPHVDPD